MNVSTDPQMLFHNTQVGVCEPLSSVSQLLSSSDVLVDELALPEHFQKSLDEFQEILSPKEGVTAEVLQADFAEDFAASKDDVTTISVVHYGMTMVSCVSLDHVGWHSPRGRI